MRGVVGLFRIFGWARGKLMRKGGRAMQVKSFLLTLGLGMLAGGAAMLMLPRDNVVRVKAQQAVDAIEDEIMG